MIEVKAFYILIKPQKPSLTSISFLDFIHVKENLNVDVIGDSESTSHSSDARRKLASCFYRTSTNPRRLSIFVIDGKHLSDLSDR